MNKYNPSEIEPKWQKKWEEAGVFHASNTSDKPKYYALIEFPYPSGQGLHVGHPRPYTALDVVSRKRRMEGYNVLYPIGWDAFGLPAENYAIKNHVHPEEITKKNIARFKQQIQSLGISFDWSREISTIDPKYYKWTQWIFLQLFKNGLAYKKEMSVNWCTSCKCVLANEEVVNGVCERCGSEVIHKVKSQWMLKITAYAQRLIDDLDLVDYPDRVKTQQKNWIGRSEGAEVDFNTTAGDKLTVYTTRPDTLYGATYMVVSPEHPFIEKWADKLQNLDAVRAYQAEAAKKADFERTERQRMVMQQVMQKATKNPFRLASICMSALPEMTTNLSAGELYGYAVTTPLKLATSDLKQQRIPEDGTFSGVNIDGEDVLQIDFDAAKQELKDTVFASE